MNMLKWKKSYSHIYSNIYVLLKFIIDFSFWIAITPLGNCFSVLEASLKTTLSIVL